MFIYNVLYGSKWHVIFNIIDLYFTRDLYIHVVGIIYYIGPNAFTCNSFNKGGFMSCLNNRQRYTNIFGKFIYYFNKNSLFTLNKKCVFMSVKINVRQTFNRLINRGLLTTWDSSYSFDITMWMICVGGYNNYLGRNHSVSNIFAPNPPELVTCADVTPQKRANNSFTQTLQLGHHNKQKNLWQIFNDNKYFYQ